MRRSILMTLLGALCPVLAMATTFLMTTPEQKIRDSKQVCAVDVKSLKTELKGDTVFTVARVSTIECPKGNLDGDFDVIWPGGSFKKPSGEVRKTVIPGTPRLIPGQKVVLHLWRKNETDRFTIHSWSRGVIPMKWDSELKDFVLELPVPKDFRQVEVPAPKKGQGQTAFSVDRPGPPTLRSFSEKVKRVMNE